MAFGKGPFTYAHRRFLTSKNFSGFLSFFCDQFVQAVVLDTLATHCFIKGNLNATRYALLRTDGPTLIALTRQAIPIQNDIPQETRRDGVVKGAYVARKETGELEAIILATGSELQHAIN